MSEELPDSEWEEVTFTLRVPVGMRDLPEGLAEEVSVTVFELIQERHEERKNNLEAYWKHGEGAAKVRWGTPGDFTRCRKHLLKHVGPGRAERICAQWHHEMTGIWPGEHGGSNKNGPG